MVVVCAPFMEMVGNVVPAIVGCRVLKVDHNVSVVWGDTLWQLSVEQQQVSILSVVV